MAASKNAKTLDVRGLEHGEREGKIFPAIDGLKEGQALRLVVEFNPVPLVTMLRARGEFELRYEKEGPDEWVLAIRRTSTNAGVRQKLKRLLKELKEGKVSGKAKEEAREFLETVDAKTLGLVEQELIREGVSPEQIRGSLCDIHLEVMKDSLVKQQLRVKAPHPINTFMEEHKIILKYLDALGAFASGLKRKKNFDDVGAKGLAELKHIAHHLVEAESHHQREEDVLFPALERHDIVEPPHIMRMDHVELRKRKKALNGLASKPKRYKFEEFKQRVVELGTYLATELEAHIFKEDNILYQMALQALTEEEWKEVKKKCDKIGYCCFTPKQ